MDFYSSTLFGEMLLLLSFAVGIVAHEAAHAIAGLVLGLPVRQVTVGAGRALARIRLQKPMIVIRPLPISGYVALAAQPGMSRRRFAAMIAAGPAANAMLLAIACFAARLRPGWDDQLLPIGIAQAMMLLAALLPWRSKQTGRPRPSDGLLLWQLARGTASDPFTVAYAALAGLFLPAGTPVPTPSASAPELVYQTFRSDRMYDPVAAKEAENAMRTLLGKQRDQLDRVLILDFLAGNGVLLQAGNDPAELDAWSAEALALLPCTATEITRAGVLATTGRGAEAEALLRPLLPTLGNPVWTVLARLHLAQAAAAQGHAEAARGWLADARRLAAARKPMRPLLRRLLNRAERAEPLAPALVDPGRDAAINPA